MSCRKIWLFSPRPFFPQSCFCRFLCLEGLYASFTRVCVLPQSSSHQHYIRLWQPRDRKASSHIPVSNTSFTCCAVEVPRIDSAVRVLRQSALHRLCLPNLPCSLTPRAHVYVYIGSSVRISPTRAEVGPPVALLSAEKGTPHDSAFGDFRLKDLRPRCFRHVMC